MAEAKIDRELAREMRYEGKTFSEIGEYFGVSQQAVSRVLKNCVRSRKREARLFDQIPYKGIYEFIQSDEKITVPRFAVIMGMPAGGASTEKARRLLEGNQCVALFKRNYDALIAATGMTYEQLFELREGFGEAEHDST